MIARESNARRLFPDHDEAAGVSVRQGLQQDRIDKAEESRAHPDSESKDYDNEQCNSRILPERPKACSQFAPQIHNHFAKPPGRGLQFRCPFFCQAKMQESKGDCLISYIYAIPGCGQTRPTYEQSACNALDRL